jgi:hypothetical protein
MLRPLWLIAIARLTVLLPGANVPSATPILPHWFSHWALSAAVGDYPDQQGFLQYGSASCTFAPCRSFVSHLNYFPLHNNKTGDRQY